MDSNATSVHLFTKCCWRLLVFWRWNAFRWLINIDCWVSSTKAADLLADTERALGSVIGQAPDGQGLSCFFWFFSLREAKQFECFPQVCNRCWRSIPLQSESQLRWQTDCDSTWCMWYPKKFCNHLTWWQWWNSMWRGCWHFILLHMSRRRMAKRKRMWWWQQSQRQWSPFSMDLRFHIFDCVTSHH